MYSIFPWVTVLLRAWSNSAGTPRFSRFKADLLKARLKIWLIDGMFGNLKKRKIHLPFKNMCFCIFSEECAAVWRRYHCAWWAFSCLAKPVGPGQTLQLTLLFTVSLLNPFYELCYCVRNNTLFCLRDSSSFVFPPPPPSARNAHRKGQTAFLL